MKSTADKREREKRVVSEMTAAKNTTPKADFVPNVQIWKPMPG